MVTCIITLKDGTTRMDVGEGDGIMGNLHECVCKAKKQAFTDALKRAARKYGKFLGLGMSEVDGGKRNAPMTDVEVRRGEEDRDARSDNEQFWGSTFLHPSTHHPYPPLTYFPTPYHPRSARSRCEGRENWRRPRA